MASSPPIDTDGEDFSVDGDQDGDNLDVKDLKVKDNLVKFKVRYSGDCSDLVYKIYWGDGQYLWDRLDESEKGEYQQYIHDYGGEGDYKIIVAAYCDGRQVAVDSDVIMFW